MSGVAPESPADFDRLLDDLCNKCIDDAGRKRLAEILLTSDEACQKYVDMVYLCVGISYLTGVQTQPALTGQPGSADAVWPFPAPESGSGDLPTTGPSTFAFSASQLFRSWVGWRKSALAAAALMICTAIGFVASRWTDPSRDSQREIAIESTRDSATASNGFDARTVRIDSGSARITLPKVGYMLIDGPAEVDLINPLRAKLNRGRIRVRVTEPTGRGFVVETPDGDVADLSTEFGLDVAAGKKTGVVVFDGEVDLHPGKSAAPDTPGSQRLVGGEGVLFNRSGELDRIVSIVTGQVATFLPDDGTAASDPVSVITKVSDNLQSSETKKFFEIVPGGLRDDVLAYGDRPEHEWNGVDGTGLPEFLVGADYVKTFSDDKVRTDVEISVLLSRPAKLYIFYDDQMKPPKWLESKFRKTKYRIGMDLGPWPTIGRPVARAIGAGISVDHSFVVWERVVQKSGTVKLGGNSTRKNDAKESIAKAPYMYGIAAVALDSATSPTASVGASKTVLEKAKDVSTDDANSQR